MVRIVQIVIDMAKRAIRDGMIGRFGRQWMDDRILLFRPIRPRGYEVDE